MSTGIRQLRDEMARQHGDALQSLFDARVKAPQMAAALRDAGRLALLGMGGSHWINRVACTHYRRVGLDATTHVVSEYLRDPLPGCPAMLLTSQSGRSGEVLRMIDAGLTSPVAFGLTMEAESPLAQSLTCLVGVGESELSYAATRSQLIALAQHGALLEALGADIADCVSVLEGGATTSETEAAIELLAAAPLAVMTARGMSAQGIMEAASLCLMETARMPVLAFEAGQFRHGPFEMIEPDAAVIMLRGAGPEADDIAPLADECVSYGIAPVIIDASGRIPVKGAVTVPLARRRGLALAMSALPLLQEIIVSAAERRLPDAGIPRRSTKVASAEVV